MKQLVAALEDYSDKMEQWAKKGILGTVLTIHSTAQALAPVDTGFLRELINFKMMDGGLKGVVSVGADYAVYVEYGTGIYATKGSRAKKIPWTFKSMDGDWVTTFGSPPQPFWGPAIDAGEKYFNDYFG